MRIIAPLIVVIACAGCGATPEGAARKQWLATCDTAVTALEELAARKDRLPDKTKVEIGQWQKEADRFCSGDEPPASMTGLNVAVFNLMEIKAETAE